MSRLLDWFSGRPKPAAIAAQVAAELQKRQPDAGWILSSTALSIPGRIIVHFEPAKDGVTALVHEPGLPGDDPPPALIRYSYDITNFAISLQIRSGGLSLHNMRPNAAYVVLRDFKDESGHAFPKGTRLTYRSRNFVPYHGGHTVFFAEATVYLHEDDPVCRRFEEYFGVEARA
ncbi:MAG: DUF3601 domain-containing protein [Bryobacteraceae bacterium]